MTPSAAPGIVAGKDSDLDDLTREFWQIVQRVRRLPLPGIDKAALLADIEAAHRAIRETEQEQRRASEKATV